MGELRTRRPPGAPPLGRSGTVINGHDPRGSAVQRADEESLLEEEGHLRRQVATLRKESAEVKERLKMGERESLRKDKLLQELLTTTQSSSSVRGEALDEVREDIQALLQFKRRAQEARQVLEEKEQKIFGIQQELRGIRILEMEEDVASAKMEAKAKANAWAEANAGDKDTHCFVTSRGHQLTGKTLVTKITEAENSASSSQRRLATLQDERTRLEKAVQDHGDQILKLEAKRTQIQQQKDECEGRLESLSEVAEQHARLRLECDARYEEAKAKVSRQQEEELARALRPGGAAASSMHKRFWEVNKKILEPGFQPVRHDPSAGALLWRLRRAVEAPASDHGQKGLRSAWELLDAQDSDRDGCVNAAELTQVFHRLRVAGGDVGGVNRLISAMDDALVKSGTLVPVVDLVLALPLQPPPSGPAEADLESAVEALAWACKRRRMSEQELRRRIGGWVETSSANLEDEALRLCVELGLSNQVAHLLGRGLEARREQFARLLPSWRSFTPKVAAATLARFVRDVATYRDAVLPKLSESDLRRDPLVFEDFLQACSCLGAHWSRDVLENVAFSAEAGHPEAGAPPQVDGARLARAAGPGGFSREFPEVVVNCTKDALDACEKAASSPSRRPGTQPGRGSRPASVGVGTPEAAKVAGLFPSGVEQMPPATPTAAVVQMPPAMPGVAGSPHPSDHRRGSPQGSASFGSAGLPASPGAADSAVASGPLAGFAAAKSAAASLPAAATAVSATPKAGLRPESPALLSGGGQKSPPGQKSPSSSGEGSYDDDEFDEEVPEESGEDSEGS
mmetsp:Transcript_88079/g.161558  ORF Transcript_88079/g.161558 Transcript_88079/m.161558 type:complete len:799 (+) Transcript_88079:33-2429(+)